MAPTSTVDTSSELGTLVEEINSSAALVSSYIEQQNLPRPSFQPDTPFAFPIPGTSPELQQARLRLLEASKKLYDLTLGPTDMLIRMGREYMYDCATLRAIEHFRIPKLIPLDGEASFTELAKSSGLGENFVRRIIRYATLNRIFRETRPGFVGHTAASAVLANDNFVQCNITHHLVEGFTSAAKLVEALELASSNSEELSQTPFNLAFQTNMPYFEYMSQPGNEKMKRTFHETMRGYTQGYGYSSQHLISGSVDWENIPPSGLVVDVGGSHGVIVSQLARTYSKPQFIVQDRAEVVEEAQKNLSDELRGRVLFTAHNFFQEQPVKTAEAYILRMILHDWEDKEAVQILQNLVAVMKPGAKIVVMDVVLPPPNTVPSVQEKVVRSVDMQMMTLLNARERSFEEWKALFNTVDKRLKVSKVVHSPTSALSVMELVLEEAI